MNASVAEPCVVSVILPVYNGEKFIQRAMESLLIQDVAGCEILVVNDGSTDGTAAKLEGYTSLPQVKILTHPGGGNRGLCTSRRLALLQARGEFLAFLDADDEYLPGKLARHIEFLRGNPDVLLVHGPVRRRSDNPADDGWTFDMGREAQTYDLTQTRHFLRRNYMCNSTVVCRRSALRTEEDVPPVMLGGSEDWVPWNCIGLRGLFHYDPEPLTIYADHADSITYRILRKPGAVEMTAIEFYLCMLPRLPHLRMRLRACVALLYYLHALAELRRGPVLPRGPVARLLDFLFRRIKRT
jgi:glycosyltransferase involved in cell wall biosynthesis